MFNPSQPDYSNTPVCDRRPKYRYERACPEECPFPLVTLVTARSCQSNSFDETAASLLGQSLQDWEWIIAEGSTTAGGPPIVDQYGRADPRVRVVPGKYDTDQELFQLAKSARAPLLLFLGCGDLLEPTALEKLWWFLESHPQYAFVRGYSVGFGGSNRLLREPIHDKYSVMFRRTVFLEIEDSRLDFWGQCIQRGRYGGTVPEFLSWRRLETDEHAGKSAEIGSRGTVWRNGIPQGKHVSSTSSDAGETSNHIANFNGKRRLLLIAPHLEIGGADKFNLDMIACLQQNHAYEVSVVTTLSGANSWRYCFEGLTPDVFTLHTFLLTGDYSRFLLHLVESRRPDTVLIANSRTAYQLLPQLRSASRASFVDYLHMEDCDPQGYPQLSLRYASLLDSTIVSSQYLKQRLVEDGRDTDRIHVCTTNIDPQLWNPSDYDVPAIRTKYGVPDGVPVIAFIARLCQQKQPDIMAAVLKTIRDRNLRFTCLVAGEGPHRRWLEDFVKKHHLNQVKLLGAVPSEQVRKVLAISDVFFMPSENEGIALTLFEAMSMGVPAVAAEVGGQAELLSSACGILIKPGPSQIAEYADALERLLMDQGARASAGLRSRERISHHFTLQAMGSRMASLLESASRNSNFDPTAAQKNWRDPEGAGYAEPSHEPLRGLMATALLVFSPRNFGLKVRNLSLLGRILLDQKKRIRLADAFDGAYYLSHQPDLRARGVTPLLHYSLQGYLEDRMPSPHFDSAVRLNRHPGIVVNPLLWSIVQEDD